MMIPDFLLSSDGARALGSLVDGLARQWTANMHTCDEVNIVFDAIRGIVACTLSRIATEYNSAHDLLRVLPPEVQEPCFGTLPISDRCRLSLVCSHWGKTVATLPGIWNCLDLTNWTPAMDDLFARSGQLPLDLSVETCADIVSWESTLRAHANRLRTLAVYYIDGDINVSLNFAAPHLEELSIVCRGYDTPYISHIIFDQHAPLLRTLRLDHLPMPPPCPAFVSVTAVTLQHTYGPLGQLFAVMPHLQILEIVTDGYWADLPALPPQSSFRVLRLVDTYLTVEQAVQLGYYSTVEILDVSTTRSNVAPFYDTIVSWAEEAATVRVRADWTFDVVQRPGGRQTRFAVRPHHYQVFQNVFCRGGTNFDRVQHLVLPASFWRAPYGAPRPVLLDGRKVISLHSLRTLTIECSQCEYREFRLRDCIAGCFDVPRLARVEVLKATDAPRDGPIEPVDVADLLALVQNVLIGSDHATLEVFVDTASGVLLVGDADPLRGRIGRLLL